MKKYKCIKMARSEKETEEVLNKLAEIGWELKCSYFNGVFFVLEREVKQIE